MNQVTLNGIKFTVIERKMQKLENPTLLICASGQISANKPFWDTIKDTIDEFTLAISDDGSNFALIPAEKGGYNNFSFTKSGRTNSVSLLGELKARGVTIPCRYGVTMVGNAWIGKLADQQPKMRSESAAKKPRKTGLGAMLPEGSKY